MLVKPGSKAVNNDHLCLLQHLISRSPWLKNPMCYLNGSYSSLHWAPSLRHLILMSLSRVANSNSNRGQAGKQNSKAVVVSFPWVV